MTPTPVHCDFHITAKSLKQGRACTTKGTAVLKIRQSTHGLFIVTQPSPGLIRLVYHAFLNTNVLMRKRTHTRAHTHTHAHTRTHTHTHTHTNTHTHTRTHKQTPTHVLANICRCACGLCVHHGWCSRGGTVGCFDCWLCWWFGTCFVCAGCGMGMFELLEMHGDCVGGLACRLCISVAWTVVFL